MKEDIKSCVDVRINMFKDYLEVPESIAEEYKNFEAKMLSIALDNAVAAGKIIGKLFKKK